MEFSVRSANEYAKSSRIEEWIHTYLGAGDWANPGLSSGLKLARRWWFGPVEVPLELLVRKCGPEAEMEYQMPQHEWDLKTERIGASLTDPLLLPPIIVQSVKGKLIICDGSHRHEGARRRGWESLWALIWFDSEEEYNQSHPRYDDQIGFDSCSADQIVKSKT